MDNNCNMLFTGTVVFKSDLFFIHIYFTSEKKIKISNKIA